MKHSFIIITVCVIPFLLFFSFPLLGLSGDWSLLLFVVLLFGGHLLMLTWHSRQTHMSNKNTNTLEVHDDN